VADIKEAQTEGDKIVLLLDRNMNMKDSIMASAFTTIGLEEKIFLAVLYRLMISFVAVDCVAFIAFLVEAAATALFFFGAI